MEIARKHRGTREHNRAALSASPRHVRILTALANYRTLDSRQLHQFVGGNLTNFLHELRRMWDHGYLKRTAHENEDAQDTLYSFYPINLPEFYELDDRGRKRLMELGVPVTKHRSIQFHHTVVVEQGVSSIELACIELGIRFISWREILESERMPAQTRDSDDPMEIPAAFSHTFENGKTHHADKPYCADKAFGFQYPNGSYRFFVYEGDRSTEPLKRSNLFQSSYLRKIRQTEAIFKHETYKKHWGLPNLMMLNVTMKESRTVGITSLAEEIIGKARWMCTKTLPRDNAKKLLTEPWLRPGYPPINLADPDGR